MVGAVVGGLTAHRLALVRVLVLAAGSVFCTRAAAAPDAASCVVSLEPRVGAVASRWSEVDDDGRTLVRERGALAQWGLALTTRDCHPARLSLLLERSTGTRDYAGRSNTGAALATRSDIRDLSFALTWWPQRTRQLPFGGDIGLRLHAEQLRREIRSTASARGYPERFDRVQGALVAAFGRPWSTGGAAGSGAGSTLGWHAELALGGGPAARLRLALADADPTRLRTGPVATAQVLLALEGRSAGWPVTGAGSAADRQTRWRIALAAGTERMAAGTPAAITRNGLVVASAVQPASRRSSLALQAAWVLPLR